MSYFKAKMHQIRFPLGLRPRSRWGELTALPQTPELDIRKPTSKGREGRKDGMEGQGRREKGRNSIKGTESVSIQLAQY